MKRLVDYGSDDDDGDHAKPASENAVRGQVEVKPSKRPKALPALSRVFDVDPVDDPSLHQGRTRSRAYVHGTYYGHVYLTLRISKRLESVLRKLQAAVSARLGAGYQFHDLFSGGSLHISLSHPLPLRKHQIQEFESHLAREVPRFGAQIEHAVSLSLASGITVYENGVATQTTDKKPKDVTYRRGDELDASGDSALDQLGRTGFGQRRRAFLALRVSAGHDVLERLERTILEPFLRLHHLPLYHSDPQYHASFAWTLLGDDGRNPLDDDFVRQVGQDWSEKLDAALPSQGWEVAQVECKIGSKVIRYDL